MKHVAVQVKNEYQGKEFVLCAGDRRTQSNQIATPASIASDIGGQCTR